ncbi:MAG: nuclear transport factor 2 family protein [Candidatus Brevundimonas phytovorans]|nr:nuclear transport factor 2 family protein [Brevundimonas sp.]WEK58150.1 MAG: nuclear transport factor 2 family protein [Brevundimonas sp.]
MSRPIELLRQLMVASEARDTPAFVGAFAPDVEYHYHVGSRPLIGRDWVEKFITKYWANHTETKWTLVNWAENGDVLMTEGVEEYVNAAGVKVAHPYMGVIEFKDGKVVAWRDYFQMKDPAAA